MKNITCFSCCVYILLNLDQKNERCEILIESIIVTDFNFRKMIMNKTNMLLVFVLRRAQAQEKGEDMAKQECCMFACTPMKNEVNGLMTCM